MGPHRSKRSRMDLIRRRLGIASDGAAMIVLEALAKAGFALTLLYVTWGVVSALTMYGSGAL